MKRIVILIAIVAGLAIPAAVPAHAQNIELACPAGTQPVNGHVTLDQRTQSQRQWACVNLITGQVTIQPDTYLNVSSQGTLVTNGLMAQYQMLPSETPGALVDYSGNGNNATGTTGTAPTIIAGTGGVLFAGSGAINLPAALNSALTIEVFFSYNGSSNGNAENAVVLGNNGSNYIGLLINASNDSFDPWGPPCTKCARLRTYSPGNTFKNSSVNPVVGTNFYTFTMAATDHLFIGANEVAYYQNAFSSAGLQTAGNYELGGLSGKYFNGSMYYALFYNRVLSQAEINQNAAYVETVMAGRGVSVATQSIIGVNRLVAAGDSITQGPPGLPVGWPEDADFTLNGTWDVANVGVSGYKTYDMNAITQGSYIPLYDKSANNALVLFGGANNPGVTGEQYERDICYQAHIAGFRCLVATMLDQTGADAGKNAFNGQLRQDFATFSDGLIDIAANPDLGADGASTNATYFQQPAGIHPTQAGTDLIAGIMARIVNRIYGNGDFTTATTYAASTNQADADQYAILGGSSSGQTYTLETCVGWTAQNLYIKNTDANSWAVAAAAGEEIDGSSSVTVASGNTLILQDVLTSPSTAGCSWTVILQDASGTGNAISAAQTSAATNFGTALATQTIVASVPANTPVFVTVQPVQSLAGVTCSALSNTVIPVISYTDANTGSVETITGSAGAITGDGSVSTGLAVGNYATSSTSQAWSYILAAKSGTAITYTTTSSLSSISCTVTPQYTVMSKAVY